MEDKVKSKYKQSSKVTIAVSASALALSLVLLLVFLLMPVGFKGEFKPQALDIPAAQSHALKQYGFDELNDVKTTLRADTMYVTERNLKRAQPKLLSDVYALAKTVSGGMTYTDEITFTKYPTAAQGIKADDFEAAALQKAQEQGLDTSSAAGKADAKEKYFLYYKYMLLSQGMNLMESCVSRSKSGTLTQDNLLKHPAADGQYGEVTGSENAVEKVMIMDPVYRSHHATGLYLPAGEAVTVKVEGMKSGENIGMLVSLQDSMGWTGNAGGEKAVSLLKALGAQSEIVNYNYSNNADILTAGGKFYDLFSKNDQDVTVNPLVSSQWQRQNNRLPYLSANFNFPANGEYTVGTPFGGVLHISPNNAYSSVKITVRGAVETPHYILGVTTPQYFDTYLKNPETAPGVYSVLDTENGQLVGPSSYMRGVKTDEIEKLAMLWHSFFSVNETFTGGTYNRNNIVKFDTHVPAGAAVALGGMVYACPSGWYGSAMNYRGLLRSGSWGILHEIGHSHGNAYGTVWGFGGNMEGEVRNNALIVLSYMKFCDLGSAMNDEGNIPAEHGFVGHAFSNLKYSLQLKDKAAYTDFNDCDYFEALSMYVNVMHSFGADKFFELLFSYKANPSTVPIVDGQAIGNKRSDFAYRCALVFGMDFRDYFNALYKAQITDEMFSAEQNSRMNALPKYFPVANRYAGGIDGVKTGGDYLVNYGNDVKMDLEGMTISSADKIEVISVKQPKHGKITRTDEVYSYSFDEKYRGAFDSFDFYVKLNDDQVHKFTVTLRISYNGARIESYAEGAAKNIDEAEAELGNLAAPAVTYENYPGINRYNESGKGTKIATFYYKAEESGEATFSVIGDDQAKVYFGESFDALQHKTTLKSYNGAYSDNASFTFALKKDQYYAVKIVNYNAGGAGYAALGIKNFAGKYETLPSAGIFPSDMTDSEKIVPFVFQPKFMVSMKDNILNSSLGSDKSEWKVLSAPEDIAEGRYADETFFDPETGKPIGTVQVDKWTYLTDSKEGTTFHTVWDAGATPATDLSPDVFVIDTNRIQPMNYLKITAPNRSDYRIVKYELLLSKDNVNFVPVSTGENALEYKNGVANITFPQTEARYIKLAVKKTSADNGGAYTVISELDAGITSKTQMILPAAAEKYYFSKEWSAADSAKGQPLGTVWSQKAKAKMAVKFKGTSVSLFCDKNDGFGGATVKIDGKDVGSIVLQSQTYESKQLVFHYEGLADKEHTLEIITNSSQPFNLNFIGASYNSVLLNAPNIYLERGLIIALIVVSALLAVAAAALVLIVFVPSVRDKVFKKSQDSAAKTEKNKAKSEAYRAGVSSKTSSVSKSAVENAAQPKDASDKRGSKNR